MTRILFVDDESRVLDGLRRMLHGHRSRWQMTFALGGDAALAALEAARYDVLVTDMRMPRLDGLALLTQARDRWPGMTRIILSGYMDMEVAVRAASLAHQFLAKPCDASVLEEAVTSTQRLAGLLTNEALRATVGEIGALATRPTVYAELERVIAAPGAVIAEVSAIIQHDVALTAKALQLVNSSFFGLPHEVTSVDHAVAYLGANVIRAIVLSHEITDLARASTLAPGFSVVAHQAHALRVATLARRVAGTGRGSDDAFLAGVLHDVGELVLAMRRPEWLAEAPRHAAEHGLALHEAEAALFGVSHAEVGAYLVGLWGVPHRIVEAIAHHHVLPSTATPAPAVAAASVYVAEALIGETAAGAAHDQGSRLDAERIVRLGLPPKLDAWRAEMARTGGSGA